MLGTRLQTVWRNCCGLCSWWVGWLAWVFGPKMVSHSADLGQRLDRQSIKPTRRHLVAVGFDLQPLAGDLQRALARIRIVPLALATRLVAMGVHVQLEPGEESLRRVLPRKHLDWTYTIHPTTPKLAAIASPSASNTLRNRDIGHLTWREGEETEPRGHPWGSVIWGLARRPVMPQPASWPSPSALCLSNRLSRLLKISRRRRAAMEPFRVIGPILEVGPAVSDSRSACRPAG